MKSHRRDAEHAEFFEFFLVIFVFFVVKSSLILVNTFANAVIPAKAGMTATTTREI